MSSIQSNDKNIAIFCGGYSTEAKVSLKSGQNIYEATQKLGYQSQLIKLPNDERQIISFILEVLNSQKIDLVVNALHGEFGENGKLQAILETLGVPFTGSGVLASSLGMDKVKLYELLITYNIRVPKTVVINKFLAASDIRAEIKSLELQFELPIFVKPNVGGSSIGVTKVEKWEQLPAAIDLALESSQSALIQEFVHGLEITCPVLDKTAMPVGEIIVGSSNKFFDFEAKYSSKITQEIFPANLPPLIFAKVQELSLFVHELIGARGLTRSDFIFDPIRNEVVFLEINTCPGMTTSSLTPKSAQSLGWTLEELVSKIIELGE